MIRAVNRSEIPACAALIRESFLTVARDFGFTRDNAPDLTAFATDDDMLYQHFDDESRKMFAFLFEDKIVGYYSLLLLDNNVCELNHLCVSPACRHRGIGEQLLEHGAALAQSLGMSKIEIGIVEENVRLRQWYESHGFTHVKTEKFDFFPFTCGYMEYRLQQDTKQDTE